MIPAHLGPLHPAEQWLTLLLAFGPLLLLAVTVWISRRHRGDDGSLGSRDAAEATGHRTTGRD